MSTKKMTTENKLLIGGVALAGIAGIIALVSNSGNGKKLGDETFSIPPQTPTPAPTQSNSSSNTPTYNPPAPIVLNKNLVLKVGSKGNEVKELQKLLGITADGNFGPQTEAALKAKKGVVSITLATYATTPDVNRNSYPKGTKVFSNVKGAKLYGNLALPNGTNQSTGIVEDTVEYSKIIGTIEGASAGAVWYRVNYTGGWGFDAIRWVLASEVKNY